MAEAFLRSRGAVAEQPPETDVEMIVFKHVSLAFDDTVVLRDVSFTLRRGHTKIILGASGAGKSISLKLILGLLKPDGGEVWVKGQRVDQMSELEMMKVRADLGMVFQEGARVEEVLGFVGLAQFIDRKPSELSGGQRRRVAIARAMTVKPGILLYDEPTTGLDPITADTIDEQIVKLRDLEEVTSILVTHQLRDAFFVATHEAKRSGQDVEFVLAAKEKLEEAEFMMLKDGIIIFEGTADELRASSDPYIQAFLS
jgi:phospholipid/cholesterol/gamma-HCH transport system ATP-binding protein